MFLLLLHIIRKFFSVIKVVYFLLGQMDQTPNVLLGHRGWMVGKWPRADRYIVLWYGYSFNNYAPYGLRNSIEVFWLTQRKPQDCYQTIKSQKNSKISCKQDPISIKVHSITSNSKSLAHRAFHIR